MGEKTASDQAIAATLCIAITLDAVRTESVDVEEADACLQRPSGRKNSLRSTAYASVGSIIEAKVASFLFSSDSRGGGGRPADAGRILTEVLGFRLVVVCVHSC